tara:strand:+ start:729 stop:1211 length:483 start_codon:yes stop_codon:yes gene_type:complete
MSYTKRQFVSAALEEIGLGAYEFDAQPEQLQSALRSLDNMLASWEAKGIRIGYPLPNNPEDSDLDEKTNVPNAANLAIIKNLGIEIAPSYGRQVSPGTTKVAKSSYNTLLAQHAQSANMQLSSNTPLGAGNKTWRNQRDPFAATPNFGIEVGDDSFLEGS